MFTEGIFPIGDGMLDVDEQLLKGLLVPHDINDIYDVEQTPFARGKFAAVRRAIHKNSGVHFAAKFLKRRRRAQSSDKEIKHEIAVLMLCDGAENIVKLNAVHESRSDTALLLELATGGELQTFLDNEECLSETQSRYCMREVLKGLEYLHKRSIAHLDLKPQNILLTGENIEDGLKLCDFGISRVVAEGSNVREIVGTPDYVAPEVLQYEPLSLLTDIWSVGVLAYVLLTGFSPFGGDTKQETFLNISQCALEFPDKLFGGVSAAAIDFIRRALRIKPNDRMTAAGCLEHIWLKDECAIGRQVFNKLSQIAANSEDDEEEIDDDNDGDGNDDVNDEAEHNDEVVEHVENIVKQVNDEVDKVKNGSHVQNMDSSDTEVENLPINGTSGKTHKYQNGTASLASASTTIKQTNGTKTTTTTTAVHTVPAARATTIPLCTHIHQKHYQQQQQQLQQHIQNSIAGRRHSSDANKENTFLATKKIVPTTNTAGKKTNGVVMQQQTTTATIIIGTSNASLSDENDDDKNYDVGEEEEEEVEEEEYDEESAQLACNGNSSCNNGSSLFPDAPTTPKVIRKAPTTDTSPTSVKALVKKFQLEGGNQQIANNNNNSTIITTMTTAMVSTLSGKSSPTLKQQQQQNSSRKSTTTLIVNGYKNNGTTTATLTTNGCSRRFSEPHINGKTTTKITASTSMTTSPASYKSTCVYCLTCGATSNNTGNSQSSTDAATKSTTNGCRHSTVTAVTTTSPIKTSLIPLYQHHHHHNHHHHHHPHAHHHHHELLVVAKNGAATAATSNLSVDQGIIC